MDGYEILEHTGDVKIRAYGSTKEELFENAMHGMMAILNSKVKSQNSKVRKVKLESQDINALLVDFLSEVNYLRQVNREAYEKVNFITFSDSELEAELKGYKVEEFGEDIKAVTFHDLDIHQNPQGTWETVIVFDV